MTTKICKICGQEKALTDFYLNHRADYRRPYCKTCDKQMAKERLIKQRHRHEPHRAGRSVLQMEEVLTPAECRVVRHFFAVALVYAKALDHRGVDVNHLLRLYRRYRISIIEEEETDGTKRDFSRFHATKRQARRTKGGPGDGRAGPGGGRGRGD